MLCTVCPLHFSYCNKALYAVGVGKKIDGLAKQRICREVGFWKKTTVNQINWCGASLSSGKEIVAKQRSIVNHVQDIHEHYGEFPRCLHTPLVGHQARQQLKPSNTSDIQCLSLYNIALSVYFSIICISFFIFYLDTAACEKLTEIILAPKLLKDLDLRTGVNLICGYVLAFSPSENVHCTFDLFMHCLS